MNNPYHQQRQTRFKLTLNKLYAWSLIQYDRVVMLDSDNLFLQNTDELFQCGQFCAAFINPCIFHTGLFVLQVRSIFMFLHLFACGPNSVVTFPSAPWLKPWYWWSWPVLPLGLLWHEKRQETIGYGSQIPVVAIQSMIYLLVIVVTRFTRPNLSKLYHRNQDKTFFLQTGLKMTVMWSILATYIVPVFLIPKTVHPLLGWGLYLLGSSALASTVIHTFMLPALHVLMPWLGITGSLVVMAIPWYNNGVTRALCVFLYAFCAAPVVWRSLVKVMACLHVSLEKETFLLRSAESALLPGFNKLY